ncbi:MAG: hypothetical protein P8N98_00320, partial [Paracoccaceae bacterium]|nr:hypothetical protein [Paracoccaceae bacterium]
DYIDRNQMMPRIWRIPRIWPYSVIPIGSALLTIAFGFRLALYLKSPTPENDLRKRAMAGQDAGSAPGSEI